MRTYRIVEEKSNFNSLFHPQYRDDDVMKSATGTLGWNEIIMEIHGIRCRATYDYDKALFAINTDYTKRIKADQPIETIIHPINPNDL